MPNTVLIVLGIEALLMTVTTVFLTQPAVFFGSGPSRKVNLARWGGFFFLCVTFCWSVVVGIVMSVNELSFRL